MRKNMIWAAVALVLIAAPAVIGIAVIGGGDDGSSDARRAGALLDPKSAEGAAASLVTDGLLIPGGAGQAIEVESYQFGVGNAAAAAAGGAGAGKANFTELTITKQADVSSPMLMKACANGQHLKTATLNLRKTGGASKPGAQPYLIVKMTDVIITGYQVSGSGNGVPSESVSLNFAKIEYSYADQPATGGPGATSQMVYDLKLAKAS